MACTRIGNSGATPKKPLNTDICQLELSSVGLNETSDNQKDYTQQQCTDHAPELPIQVRKIHRNPRRKRRFRQRKLRRGLCCPLVHKGMNL